MPIEKNLWLMADVNPNEYETRADGVRVMKDWADGEFGQRFGKSDEDSPRDLELAKERKRAQARQARKRPLSEDEVRELQTLYDPQLTPDQQAGVVIP